MALRIGAALASSCRRAGLRSLPLMFGVPSTCSGLLNIIKRPSAQWEGLLDCCAGDYFALFLASSASPF